MIKRRNVLKGIGLTIGTAGAAWPAMCSALRAACAERSGFAGTSLHDLDSLLPTLPGGDL